MFKRENEIMSNTINIVDTYENGCSHFETKYEFISEFIGYLTQLQSDVGELTTDQLEEELEFFYDEAYKNGERKAYSTISSFADYKFNETLELNEEE